MTDERPPSLLRLARLLDGSFDAAVEDAPSLEVARYLGRDLTRRLRAVAEAGSDASPELLVEAARACGDLATLIACNPALLPPDEASIATRDAAAAAREVLARTEGGIASSGEQDDYLVRDVRGAIWRADLAVHQVAETSTGKASPQELS